MRWRNHYQHSQITKMYCFKVFAIFCLQMYCNTTRNTEYTTSRPIAILLAILTRRPASADRIARHQFQATGQPVSRTQASDAMTSRLPRYEAKCVQHRCFQCGSVPYLRSDIKGTELPLPIYWYHSKGNWLCYNFAAESFWATVVCLSCLWRSCTVAKRMDGSRWNLASR